jgi:hypothetical protein
MHITWIDYYYFFYKHDGTKCRIRRSKRRTAQQSHSFRSLQLENSIPQLTCPDKVLQQFWDNFDEGEWTMWKVHYDKLEGS